MMVRLLLLTVVFCGCSQALFRFSDVPGVVTVNKNISSGRNITTLDELATAIKLDPPCGLRVERSRSIANGLTKQRLRLTCDGIDVRSFALQASVDDQGRYSGLVTGFLPTITSLDTSGQKRSGELRQAAASFMESRNDRPDEEEIDQCSVKNVQTKRQIYVDLNTGSPCNAYVIKGRVERPGYIRSAHLVINADKNDTVEKGHPYVRYFHRSKRNEETSCPRAQGGNEKEEGSAYGPDLRLGQVCLNAKTVGDDCYLANSRIIVKTLDNQYDRRKAKIVKFRCEDGLSDAYNGAFSPNADVWFYAQKFFDMIEEWGDITLSRTDPIILYTHFATNFKNSFFDAYSVTFGNGGDLYYPFTTVEAVGHELGHVLSDDLGNLNFDPESLILDESLADIMGQSLRFYITGNINNWDFAPDLPREAGVSLRYFDDPTKDGWSIAPDVTLFDSVDNIYKAAGIFNHVFYCLVSSQGVPVNSVVKAFIHANAMYWQEETGFIDGAYGVYRSFQDYELDTDAAYDCFNSVGIDIDIQDSSEEVDD